MATMIMIMVMATTMTITTMTATMTTMVIRLHCDELHIVRISERHYPAAAHVPHSIYPFAPDGADAAGG